jgi:hypothetical protein
MRVKTTSSVFCASIAVLMLADAANAASSAAIDRQFSAAVSRVLNGIKGVDYLDGLSKAEKREFVACAQRVMDDAPLARKQYVLAAPNQSVMRKRFDEVALDNRAELKQRITKECAV